MYDPRIRRLRELIARLEQAPASIERDELLRHARERVVLLETGEGQATGWRETPMPVLPFGRDARAEPLR